MKLVLLTALGVGGATVIGALFGFTFKNISHKFSDTVLSFEIQALPRLPLDATHPSGFDFALRATLKMTSKKVVSC